MSFIPTPNVSGDDVPEPFNYNDVKVAISYTLHNMKRLGKPCYHPSELIMEQEMEAVMAHYNPDGKEGGLYDESNDYHKLVTNCLQRLAEKGVVRKEERIDQSDGIKYPVYCPTDLFEEVKPQIRDNELTDIDKILDDLKRRQAL
jgi:hypothetical protein